LSRTQGCHEETIAIQPIGLPQICADYLPPGHDWYLISAPDTRAGAPSADPVSARGWVRPAREALLSTQRGAIALDARLAGTT
jgi:hypothetical protein